MHWRKAIRVFRGNSPLEYGRLGLIRLLNSIIQSACPSCDGRSGLYVLYIIGATY